EPMAGVPIAAVAPDIERAGENRIRPRVPSPHVDRGRVDHPPAINRGDRIILRRRARGGIEFSEHRLKETALHEIITLLVRGIRQKTLRALRIEEHVGLVRALVDGRTADLGDPDRLALRDPAGRRAKLGAADALVVRVAPPIPKVLDAEDPRLAESVGDGAA